MPPSKRGRRRQTVRQEIKDELKMTSTEGQRLLDLLSDPNPMAVEVARHLKAKDIIQLTRCHPQLWRNRRAILTTLFNISAPDVRSAIEAANKSSGHTAVLCKRLSPVVAEHLMTRLENALIKTHQNAVLFDVIRNQTNHQQGETTWQVQNLVWKAIKYHNFEALRWLIEHFGVNKETAIEMDGDAFMAALHAGDFDTAKWLKDRYNLQRRDLGVDRVRYWLMDKPEAQRWLMEHLNVPKSAFDIHYEEDDE